MRFNRFPVLLGCSVGISCGAAALPTLEPEAPVVIVPATVSTPKPCGSGGCGQEAASLEFCPQGMIRIEGGLFEPPEFGGPLTVREFCLDRTEVTAGDYQRCVARRQCTDDGLDCAPTATYGRPERVKQSLNCVSWEQAEAYCVWLGRRIPTEPEWEWTAQGGTERRPYPWGADPPSDQLCWAQTSQLNEPCNVGSFPQGASRQGVLDLMGGMWEWLSPRFRSNGIAHVSRGASWKNSSAEDLVGVDPGHFTQDFERNDVVGFRCALTP